MRSKQHGEVKGSFIIGICVVLALVATIVITERQPSHKNETKQVAVHMKQLKPTCQGTSCKGTYVYRDTSGDWLFYYFMYSGTDNSGSTSGGLVTTNSYASYGKSLPPGGSWVKSSVGPKTEDIEEEEELSLQDSDGDGKPDVEATATVAESPEQVTEEVAGDTDAGASDVTPVSDTTTEPASATPESAPSESSSSSSDSSSSDSGSSGGDGGGGSD